jgi:hypothetical protein
MLVFQYADAPASKGSGCDGALAARCRECDGEAHQGQSELRAQAARSAGHSHLVCEQGGTATEFPNGLFQNLAARPWRASTPRRRHHPQARRHGTLRRLQLTRASHASLCVAEGGGRSPRGSGRGDSGVDADGAGMAECQLERHAGQVLVAGRIQRPPGPGVGRATFADPGDSPATAGVSVRGIAVSQALEQRPQ